MDITNYGGHQSILAFVANIRDGNMQDLLDKANRGKLILVREVSVMEWSPNGHTDTNPPRLNDFPIKSISELIENAFKRLHFTLNAGIDQFLLGMRLEIAE